VRPSLAICAADDLFALVVFDDFAQVVIPLQKPGDRQEMVAAIEQIADGGATNLMADWLLGRDELLKAGGECDRKILVLTDGHLSQGITEPDRIEALAKFVVGTHVRDYRCLTRRFRLALAS
jgi:Ca-activated chloride channel homolog